MEEIQDVCKVVERGNGSADTLAATLRARFLSDRNFVSGCKLSYLKI